MTSLTDRATTQAQYSTADNLSIRRSFWLPGADGRDPATEALAAIVEAEPRQVLEVGCGTGEFAARIQAALPQTKVVPTDQSERMVELTHQRGLHARQAEIEELPFDDDRFDAVAAMWMLYHVPDLHAGLAEVRRVLAPGGLFVAATNGDEHVAELRREAGGQPVLTQFSSENGEAVLRHHFADVRRLEFATRAVFPDHASACAYLASTGEGLEESLPWFEGPREYAGAVTVFLAR